MGIIAEKSLFNLSILSSTRLNIVYRMANIIAEGISTFIMDDIRNSVLNQTEDELTDKAQWPARAVKNILRIVKTDQYIEICDTEHILTLK